MLHSALGLAKSASRCCSGLLPKAAVPALVLLGGQGCLAMACKASQGAGRGRAHTTAPSSPNDKPGDEVQNRQKPSALPPLGEGAAPADDGSHHLPLHQALPGEGLGTKDRALVALYVAGCQHYWALLPDLAEQAYKAGASPTEVAGTIRHLITFAGYAPTLAATISLRNAGQLDNADIPGKLGGPPGNAFDLVYDKVADTVRAKLHGWDPVLSEYIQQHLYGDVYSSPGLSMRQKQMLSVSFLAEADMHDQLYTHLVAALRFGATPEACRQAIQIGFEMSGRPAVVLQPVLRGAARSLHRAVSKFKPEQLDGSTPSPQVQIPDPKSVRVPPPRVAALKNKGNSNKGDKGVRK